MATPRKFPKVIHCVWDDQGPVDKEQWSLLAGDSPDEHVCMGDRGVHIAKYVLAGVERYDGRAYKAKPRKTAKPK